MRTKVLLGLAALAVGLSTSLAQVYSLNVVGYVNITVPANSFFAIANPFNAVSAALPDGNNITNLFKSAAIADSSTIATWNPAGFGGAGDWDAPITYISGFGWDNNLQMAPGKGILFNNLGPALPLTFVGEVVQGPYTVTTLQQNAFQLVGAPVPIGGDASGFNRPVDGLGLSPAQDDTIAKWDPAGFGGAGDWTAPDTFIAGPDVWDPGTLIMGPADAFLYFRAGTTTTWVSNFTVK